MKIVIHRGTHQIGGIAVEIATDTSRILIDMGDELSLDPNFTSLPLQIPGVTDQSGSCNGVLFTHYHGDHTGQMMQIRSDVPLYAGSLTKAVLLKTAERIKSTALCNLIRMMKTFRGGQAFTLGDIRITPWTVDHSAFDSYLFLLESAGKRVLYTGYFRMHGFRGKTLPKVLRAIGKVDALIIEGTTLSRPDTEPTTERDLQQKVKEYMAQYKYVFILCASTNLERICAMSKAVPAGKYFICDQYQSDLLDLVEQYWGPLSPLYRNIKKTVYGDNLLSKFRDRGFLMAVRDNRSFRRIVQQFDPEQSLILYSMWDGYRTKADSTIPEFLKLAGQWQSLHTSGHASHKDIQAVIDILNPDIVIPVHSEQPDMLQALCPGRNVIFAEDGKEIIL